MGKQDWVVVAALFLLISGANSAPAQEKKENSAVKPAPRDANWVKRHDGFVAEAKNGNVDVLFLGDSITDGWRNKPGQEAWKQHFEAFKPINFGIGGDRTQHVLWRLQNGELEGIDPKVAVLMIGTNNLGSNTAQEIADGITAIVKEVNAKKPKTKILLLGIFPRSPEATHPNRAKIKEINAIIAKLDDGGKHVRYMDIGEKFLQPDGSLTKEIMPDFLHLSAKGYQIWGEAIEGTLKDMLR